MANSGRLELTWTNKDQRLLAHDDARYEWVQPEDWRVAEVRLLHDVATVGDVRTPRSRAGDNLLIRGDALHALTALAELPEFADEYLGRVQCCYIDPPFNTGQAFAQYDDAIEHSVWLTMFRDRLLQIRQLLAPAGTVWVHLDDVEVHRARLVLDEVFGINNYVTTVIWEKTTSGRNDAKWFSTDHDYILVYARNQEKAAVYQQARDVEGDKAYKNPDNDPRGPWREIDYKGPKSADERPNLYYPIVNPHTGKEVLPRRERVWAYGQPEHERHVRENLLYWGRTGSYTYPKLKKFIATARATAVPRTLWTADEVDSSRRAKEEIKKLFPNEIPFATPKPEKLLERVLNLATTAGDVVLDCFVGSGTTAAVAHKMQRRWIGIEASAATTATFTLPRLQQVVAGTDLGGVTKSAGWSGGGGFRVLDVNPSMFDLDGDRLVLADECVNGLLAESTAAQLGFVYEPDSPFTGRKGRQRLAVIDGLVNEGTIRTLVASLPEGERLVACGTAIDPAANDLLRDLRPGSRVRKIPSSLLSEYRTKRRTKLADVLDWSELTQLQNGG